jgi:hypothetical protein
VSPSGRTFVFVVVDRSLALTVKHVSIDPGGREIQMPGMDPACERS